MHNELHEAIGKIRPELSTPWRGRGVAVKVDCELDCQALSLLHIRYAEAGGIQPRGKVMKQPLVGDVLAGILAKRRTLQRRACLCTGTHLATLLSADVGHASWKKLWPGTFTSQPVGACLCLWQANVTECVRADPGTAGKHPGPLALAAYRMLLLMRQMDNLGGVPDSQMTTPLRWPAPCPCQTLPEVVICAGTSLVHPKLPGVWLLQKPKFSSPRTPGCAAPWSSGNAPSKPQPQKSVLCPFTARICSRENAEMPPKKSCAKQLLLIFWFTLSN